MTSSGVALMREIEATQRELNIMPYWNFSLYSTPLFPPLGFNALIAAGAGKPGVPGTNATVFFLPHMWGPQGTSGISGPGSNADEILFHEMIHGARQMRGIFKTPPVGQSYTKEEEDLAVVLSNIYLAEKKQRDLRANYEDFIALPHPEAFLTNPENASLLNNFRAKQQPFFDALAGIPEQKAWWNPVRDLK